MREAIADGWQATGIDLDMKRIQLGKERGIPNLFTGDIASMNFPDCTFAVVTMHHVLEHVADPKSFLKQVWRVLRPGGILSFEVPNFDSWTGWVLRNNTRFPWVHLSPLEHIWQMTPQGVMSIFAAVSEYFLLETLSCRSNLEHGKSGFKSKVMRAMLAPNAWFGKGDRLIGIARKLEH